MDNKRAPRAPLLICISNKHDIFYNFAVENYLFGLKNKADVLFLWRNDKVVVIGKNQNAHDECNFEQMRQKGVVLARRKSGGGAVYHDKNNLCFSFISPKETFSKEKNFSVILKALKNGFNINAELSGRNDITASGKKFSGSAYYIGKSKVLHHGTLLINTSTEVLAACLTPQTSKLARHGVKSVEARVVNLGELSGEIGHEALANQIVTSAKQVFCVGGGEARIIKIESLPQKVQEKISAEAKKMAQADAAADNFIQNAAFLRNLPCGALNVLCSLRGQKIKSAKVEIDGLNLYAAELFEFYLKGKTCAELERALDQFLAMQCANSDELAAQIQQICKI